MELPLIKILNHPERFSTYRDQVQEYILTEEGKFVIKNMEAYFDSYAKPIENWIDFGTWVFTTKAPGISGTKKAIYKQVLEKLDSLEDTQEEKDIFEALIRRTYSLRISNVANSILQDSTVEFEEIGKEYVEGQLELDKLSSPVAKLDDIFDFDEQQGQGGWTWRLNELNRSLGKLRKGDFLIFGGRPDSGKTTLLASEITYFAGQTTGTFLVLTNEERASKMRRRIVQAALGKTNAEMEKDWDATKILYNSTCSANIVCMDIYSMNTADLDKLFKKVRPELVVFDQLSKVHLKAASNNDAERLQKLASKAREWSANFPVITTIWAGADAGGTQYIEMEQLYGSKTGMQGEADAIVTIGRSYDPKLKNARFLFVPKNKLLGALPEDRNARWQVEILPEKARFKGYV